jgi:hypothetical protein
MATNQVVTLTANAGIAGFLFDKWVLASDRRPMVGHAGWDYRVEVTAGAAGFGPQEQAGRVRPQLSPSSGARWARPARSTPTPSASSKWTPATPSSTPPCPSSSTRPADYNAASKAAGTLVLIMEGNTAAGASSHAITSTST